MEDPNSLHNWIALFYDATGYCVAKANYSQLTRAEAEETALNDLEQTPRAESWTIEIYKLCKS